MASFKAQNIESDDESDAEIDNTKEIQIEEALKLYQSALKLHSQGHNDVEALKEAVEAYKSLFDSEIFKYPESQSEYHREILGQQLPLDPRYQLMPFVDASNVESAPSTLPQILHLSYKNRGELHIDRLIARLKQERPVTLKSGQYQLSTPSESSDKSEVVQALDDFAEALDKDEGDLDLWRRAARSCQILGVRRITRYCLEAALDKDEEGADAILGLPGIEMHSTANELKKLEESMEDELSLAQPLVWKTDQEPLPFAWKNQVDVYPMLPDALVQTQEHQKHPVESKLVNVEVPRATWSSTGEAILQQLTSDGTGMQNILPGSAIKLHLPAQEWEAIPNTSPRLAAQEESAQDSSREKEASIEEKPETTLPQLSMETGTKDNDTTKTKSPVDTNEQPLESPVENGSANPTTPTTMELPTRKRSTEAAELPENAEGGRIRSKRIRARESIAEEANSAEAKASDFGPELNEKIRASAEADGWLFEIISDITKKLGMDDLAVPGDIRELVSPAASIKAPSAGIRAIPFSQAIQDFYRMMQGWNSTRSKSLLQDETNPESDPKDRNAGLLSFLESSKANNLQADHRQEPSGILKFVERINNEWSNIFEVTVGWVEALLGSTNSQTYWPDLLKEVFVRIIIEIDDYLFDYYSQKSQCDAEPRSLEDEGSTHRKTAPKDANVEMIQTMFEFHLDIYSRITNPASEVETDVRKRQLDRLNKWFELARECNSLRFCTISEGDDYDVLTLRHLWASVFYLSVSSESTRDHAIACIEDLKSIWNEKSSPIIHLPNNAIMPELSIAAADSEISRLETMDFFLSIFQNEKKSPVDLIEALEPILEENIRNKKPNNMDEGNHNSSDEDHVVLNPENTNSTVQVLSRFLHRAGTSLRLSLWDKLREAYEKIDYMPKVFSVTLRNIQLLTEELKRPSYLEAKTEERENYLLDALRQLNENLARAIGLIEKHDNVLECIDFDHLKESIPAVINLWYLLYTVALYDDYSQIGQKGGLLENPFRVYPSESFHFPSIMLHNMQIQTAILLCKLFSEGMEQLPEEFEAPIESKLNFLRHVHYVFGVRRLCKASDSYFLRFVKNELMALPQLDTQTSDDLAQILYDMYDLHCFSTPLVRQPHGCDADYMDRTNALELLDFVMDKARRVNVKDLVKSDLGRTIEKVHAGLGSIPSSVAASRNRRIYLAHIRSAIDPPALFRSLNGLLEIPIVTLNTDDAVVASKGWYLLKGKIALAKANAQRSKASSGSAEDLQVAIAFFIQDLEYTADKWETWYRLAQAHDALLEEQVLWSAEQINNSPAEVAQTQRTAVHAYGLALSTFLNTLENSKDTAQIFSNLYTDFGNRLYSSARPPFSNRALGLKDFPEKQINPSRPTTDEIILPRDGFEDTLTLRLAIFLFKKAIFYKPSNWINHFMMGKIFWKAYSMDNRGYAGSLALEKFVHAVENLPERKDYNRTDPILEPIYKVVTTAHKLVSRNLLTAETVEKKVLECFEKQNQFDVSKMPALADSDSWDSWILSLLKLLRGVDKSRWHHRLVYRAAHILYEKHRASGEGARIAKDYLLEQHMYSSKTLALTVWKPDLERPGRHWVYMTSYTRFIIKLLDETNDIDALQILARRVRKKVNEFYEHTSLWIYLCKVHVGLHRRYGRIPQGHSETVFKNVDQEEFAARSIVMDQWIAEQEDSQVLRQVLAETVELKKLNAALAKPTLMDELLADTYGAIWEEIAPATSEDIKPSEIRNTPELLPPPPPPERRDMMSLTNLMNLDGNADRTPTPPPTSSQQPADASGRTRSRIVSRREITKRAFDAIGNRPAPKPATSPVKPMPRPLDPSLKMSNGDEKMDDAGTTTGLSSAPGSVHDSADDESELSDLEDEEADEPIVVKSMFPNLKPTNTAAQPAADGEDNMEEPYQEAKEEKGPDRPQADMEDVEMV